MAAMPFPRSDVPEPGLEPGDRFEVLAAGAVDGLRLPATLGPGGFAIERLEDASGRPLEMAIDPTGRRLSVEPPGRWLSDPFAAIWLEYQAPGRFRLVVEPGPSGLADGVLTTEQGVRIEPDSADREVVLAGPGPVAGLKEFDLALRAARLATHAGFDRLIALPMVRDMVPLEHQIRTATTVLRRFRGRALLCDEVGLGKTVEAGLILAELALRGLVRSVLVLVPPSLIEQWQGEMRRKLRWS